MRPRSKAFAALALALGFTSVSAEVPKGVETFEAAWKIVRDTHFDQTFNGVNWEAVRVELRPKAQDAKSIGELRQRDHCDAGAIGQSHFAIVPGGADDPASKAPRVSVERIRRSGFRPPPQGPTLSSPPWRRGGSRRRPACAQGGDE